MSYWVNSPFMAYLLALLATFSLMKDGLISFDRKTLTVWKVAAIVFAPIFWLGLVTIYLFGLNKKEHTTEKVKEITQLAKQSVYYSTAKHMILYFTAIGGSFLSVILFIIGLYA